MEDEIWRSVPSLRSIAPILSLAGEIEAERPRVAFLCRFYAFQKLHLLDPKSSEAGLKEFKAALRKVLIQDNDSSLASRLQKTDAREIRSYYEEYYDKYVRPIGRQAPGKHYQNAGVLLDVLSSVEKREKAEQDELEVSPENKHAAKYAKEKKEMDSPQNNLPQDTTTVSQHNLQPEEVKAAVATLRNTNGLNWPPEFELNRQKAGDLDVLDWLTAKFGFQQDNVNDQRELMILLLANHHKRLDPKPDPYHQLDGRAVNAVMNFLLKNYTAWCKCMGRNHTTRFAEAQQKTEQRKLLYMGLYLLIWGEAAQVHFMPEVVCFIFHNMACELQDFLTGDPSVGMDVNEKESYGGDSKAFLQKVIIPISVVIRKEQEARQSKNGDVYPSIWCNNDELAEYFWSPDCFSLGWPVGADVEFLKRKQETVAETNTEPGKSAAGRLFFWDFWNSITA